MTSNASISQAKPMPASGRGNPLEFALEASELRYRRLFETAQDGILILDAKGTALFTNERSLSASRGA
jgi:PAS domain-containing protein